MLLPVGSCCSAFSVKAFLSLIIRCVTVFLRRSTSVRIWQLHRMQAELETALEVNEAGDDERREREEAKKKGGASSARSRDFIF